MFGLERIKMVKLPEHSAPDLIQSWEAQVIENSDSQQPTWNYRQWQWWRPPAVENPKISFVILGLSDQPLQPIRHLIHQIFERVEGVVCLKWDRGVGGGVIIMVLTSGTLWKTTCFNNPQISNFDYVAALNQPVKDKIIDKEVQYHFSKIAKNEWTAIVM